MIWYYNKISEDDNSVVYAYKWHTKDGTGQLKYDKKSQEVFVLKVADNDTENGAKWVASHLPPAIIRENFPEKTTVTIG